jgi:hypothetical protein
VLFVDVHVDVLELLFEDVHEAACAGALYVFLDLAEERLFLGEGEKGDLVGEGGWVGALVAAVAAMGEGFRRLEVGGRLRLMGWGIGNGGSMEVICGAVSNMMRIRTVEASHDRSSFTRSRFGCAQAGTIGRSLPRISPTASFWYYASSFFHKQIKTNAR